MEYSKQELWEARLFIYSLVKLCKESQLSYTPDSDPWLQEAKKARLFGIAVEVIDKAIKKE